jgi:hypothetical protein
MVGCTVRNLSKNKSCYPLPTFPVTHHSLMDLFYKAVVFLYVLSIQTPAKNQLGCSCILDGSTFFLCSSLSHIFSILLLREIAMGSVLLISALPLSARKSFSLFTINFEEIVLIVHKFLQNFFTRQRNFHGSELILTN